MNTLKTWRFGSHCKEKNNVVSGKQTNKQNKTEVSLKRSGGNGSSLSDRGLKSSYLPKSTNSSFEIALKENVQSRALSRR